MRYSLPKLTAYMYLKVEVIGVTFFDTCSCSEKVTPAPTLELFGNLHSDSYLHTKILKAMSILLTSQNNC